MSVYFESKTISKPRGTVANMLEAKGNAVHGIGPRDSVLDAVQKMSDCKVGALVVMEGEALVGIISERDYTRKVILLGRASKDTPVQDIMTADVVTVNPRTTLAECLHVVTHRGIRHLPVVEGARVVGVISITDLVRAVLVQQAETIENLNSFIGSDYPT